MYRKQGAPLSRRKRFPVPGYHSVFGQILRPDRRPQTVHR